MSVQIDQLLDDAAMQQFITKGYVQVRAALPAEFHCQVRERLDAVHDSVGNPGNNILPLIPEIGQVFEDDAVRGALTSLLGPDYFMHPHRYGHSSPPGSPDQTWHKDDYIQDQNARHHRCRWVMAFYYPQDVTLDMGPTALLPGRQHHNSISDTDHTRTTEEELGVCGPEGTVTIVNFDVWHRRMANRSDRKRYMMKFMFVRMSDPEAPTWNNQSGDWPEGKGYLGNAVWNWHLGSASRRSLANGSGTLDAALNDLRHEDESRRLEAEYEASQFGESAVGGLIDALAAHIENASGDNTDKCPANPAGGNPGDIVSVQGLAAIGKASVPALVELLTGGDRIWQHRSASAAALGNIGPQAAAAVEGLASAVQDGDKWVRRNASEALGVIGICPQDGAASLIEAVSDEVVQVRWNALLALARLGEPLDDAVPAISRALADEDRYTRFYASLALRRIGTGRALDSLYSDLMSARWCPVTTVATPY
jgi:HEAT repeat protein